MYLTSLVMLICCLNASNQLLRLNHIFYFENKSQTNYTRNTVKYSEVQFSTALYFCKAVPHAAVLIIVFQVYVNYFILKCNYNEFDEKPCFEVTINQLNFRLRSFFFQGTLREKIQAAVSCKSVSYMRVLTASAQGLQA